MVSPSGEILANYRKRFLYEVDERWAEEGKDGFFVGEVGGLGKLVMGICMDINPYRFTAPFTAYEFATHALAHTSPLIVLPMAWTTRLSSHELISNALKPDLSTLSYWLARFQPIVDAAGEEEVVMVLGNRCGEEGEVRYAGTSAVLGVNGGEISVYGILGRAEEELLVVDTGDAPRYVLQSE
ncbi:MAG: Carbon-nitrogen hydrolase [Pycnora praestabilis]|nr:MAG: Carbon-nitrogen hydrolase [Pycnora praestabilis]